MPCLLQVWVSAETRGAIAPSHIFERVQSLGQFTPQRIEERRDDRGNQQAVESDGPFHPAHLRRRLFRVALFR